MRAAFAAAASTVVVYGPFKGYTIGEKRQRFVRVAAWASALLPLGVFLEGALLFTMSFWWFLYPAQLIVGGLLGLSGAILSRKWWWALLGVLASLWGMLWVATVVFWAR